MQHEANPLLQLYVISEEDLARIREFGETIAPELPRLVESFYTWLSGQPENEQYFSDPQTLERVKLLQVSYWQEFFRAQVDETYLEQRRTVGETHARIGLSLQAYFAAMNYFLTLFTDTLCDASGDKSGTVRAVTKLTHCDTAVVVDTYSSMVQGIISEQGKSLMAMSTPVTAIWQGILLLPVVGIIDSRRAQDIMNAMLAKIDEAQARVFILDISGVAIVDTAVANHLIKITKATRLMGCECTISGISPAIAQTIVELGIDVGTVKTTATMKDALEAAFRTTGVKLVDKSS
jgi:rsbT co-antagonist protein RsbR